MQKSSETVEVLPFSFWLNPNVVPYLRSEGVARSGKLEGASDDAQVPFSKLPHASTTAPIAPKNNSRNTNISR